MIYFDNNATSPLAPEVLAAMRPFLESEFGNPNSIHQAGNRARVAIERARDQVAAVIGASPAEITFCGTGSEANNLAVLGSVFARLTPGSITENANNGKNPKNMVISSVEHASVRQPARWVSEKFGIALRIAPITTGPRGVDPQPFIDLIDGDTILVSVMFANNEAGTRLPVREVFDHARAKGAVCHTDAVQGFGKLPVNVDDINCDLLTFSGHKFHGPKGASVLYVRRGTKLEAVIQGGPQEHALRPGTENVAQIVGLGTAANIGSDPPSTQLGAIRDYFEARLRAEFGDRVLINFADMPRTPNVSSVQFPGKDSKILLIKLDGKGICASSGAACNSGATKVSQVLLNMGLTEDQARATLRFSFSKYNTLEEVDAAIGVLGEVLNIPAVG